MKRSELREQMMERDNWQCRWTGCHQPAAEMAHIHSIGAGGRKSADELGNVFGACRLHARLSDGEYGSGGAPEYLSEHLKLMGPAFLEIPANLIAWERAEALRGLIDGA